MTVNKIPVSVVIPTFNRADLIKEAVHSVLSQQAVKPLEVIVIDDGSTDNTSEVLAPFEDLLTYVYQDNKGVSAARNRGIELSSGEWIAFLDSDDLWLPKKLALHWQFCLENPHFLISQTDEIWLRRGKKLNPKKYHSKPEGYCFEKLIERCLISPSAVMVHRTVFEKVGFFDERLPACEDYDMWLRVGCRFPVGLVRKKLVVKRGGHDDQLSNTVEALDRFRIFAMVKLLWRDNLSPVQRGIVLTELSKKCKIYADGALKRGKLRDYQFFLELPDMLARRTIRGEEDLLDFLK